MKAYDALFFDSMSEDNEDFVSYSDETVLSGSGVSEGKYTVLIIYDIIDDKRRVKFAKFLSSFGYRVQKSAFEARLTKKQYDRLRRGVEIRFCKEDNIRIYKLHDANEILTYGDNNIGDEEDIIFV